jgi:undecaprenyl-diphosphatase
MTTNFFDAAIIHFLNSFVHSSEPFDRLIVFIQSDGFQKGGVVIVLFWWAWFSRSKYIQQRRQKLICTMLVSPFALGLSRLISLLAPFRYRPIHNPGLHLQLARGLTRGTLDGWNSFPSDHAVLFFTFAMGLFLVSWGIGTIALVYVSLFVAVPRIYLGLHYPTDILAGALLGMGIAYLATQPFAGSRIGAPTLRWAERNPGAFYAFLFVCTYQVSNAFGEVRNVLGVGHQLLLMLMFHG